MRCPALTPVKTLLHRLSRPSFSNFTRSCGGTPQTNWFPRETHPSQLRPSFLRSGDRENIRHCAAVGYHVSLKPHARRCFFNRSSFEHAGWPFNEL